MGEKVGFLLTWAITIMFLVPQSLELWVHQNKTAQFNRAVTEVEQVVKEEGGVTSRVKNLQKNFKKSNMDIKFTDSDGNTVSNVLDPGDEIYIDYTYKYKRFYHGKWSQPKHTTSKVYIDRRV